MGILRRSGPAVVAVLLVLAVGPACSGTPLATDGSVSVARAVTPVMGSSSDRIAVGEPDGSVASVEGRKALPPPKVRRLTREDHARFLRTSAQGELAPPPPRPPGGGSVLSSPTWSTPAPVEARVPMRTASLPQATMAAPAVPLAQRCWSGCGLPCEDKVSQWHIRALGGYAIYTGTDKPDACAYWGVDVGRTFCGCWGLDLFYRVHGCRFDREDDLVSLLTSDGGNWHHIGAKLAYQRSIGGSRFYWYAGAGATYWWNDGYLVSDTGVGPFGEVGFGYVIANNWKAFVGLNVHGMDTNTGRLTPLRDEDSRWIWVWAPVAGVEFSW